VFGGPILVLGVIALVLTLLYWLVEALHLYDKDIGSTTPQLPAVVHEGPPAGVHMPGPSFRPFLGALGVTLLMLGLVFGGWLLAVGVIALIATLLGWLIDARREFVKTVEAVVLQAGLLPTGEASGGDGGEGGPSAAPSGSGDPTEGGPSGGPPPPDADVAVTARGVAFVETEISAPADTAFTMALVNEDPGTPHNIELKDASGGIVFQGEVFNGVETRVYDVPALPAGAYSFLCTVHPTTMLGTATLQ
jgi:hypothetical protein